MLDKLIPTDLPDIAPEIAHRPIRRSLAMLPDPDPLPAGLVKPSLETAKAVAEHSGFGQSQATTLKRKPANAEAAGAAGEAALDTGRMMRRSKQTELMSTRVQPETLKFLRDFANTNDMTFSKVVETVVAEFRKSKGL